MRLAERLTDAQADVVRLVICNGVLQGEDYRPERALIQLDLAAMRQVFETQYLPSNAHSGGIDACHETKPVPEDRGAVGTRRQYRRQPAGGLV